MNYTKTHSLTKIKDFYILAYGLGYTLSLLPDIDYLYIIRQLSSSWDIISILKSITFNNL